MHPRSRATGIKPGSLSRLAMMSRRDLPLIRNGTAST
jgi:hypothetical protein